MPLCKLMNLLGNKFKNGANKIRVDARGDRKLREESNFEKVCLSLDRKICISIKAKVGRNVFRSKIVKHFSGRGWI